MRDLLCINLPCRTTPALLLLLTLLGSLAAVSSLAKEPPASFSAEDLKFFETHIRPLLAERCFKCHGPAKQQGNLRLDSRSSILAGGDSGAALTTDDPAQSLLLQAVRYEALEMPPTGRLPAEQVKLLEEWVARGAPWPVEAAPADAPSHAGPGVRKSAEFTPADRQWWAFQPLVRPELPQLSDPWIRTPVDAFILNGLRAAQLAPAPEADRETLIRRATYDLWGLPPTPEAIEAFVKDDGADAYEKLIDSLLASPRYGEHWARHWLDLVRYADSNGHKSDEYRPDAWRYRDWVIRAFNDDLPYDQFVTAQLAGDEVAPDDPQTVVATGFLRHTPYESNQINVPAHWADMLNDITDVTADVFLGLGYSCARCHDHKYDPILQRDYYRLQAFFTPLLMPTDAPLATAEQREQLAQWETMTADLRRQIAELEDSQRRKLAQPAINRFPPEMQSLLQKPAAERSPLDTQWIALIERQVAEKFTDLPGKMKSAPVKEEWEALQKKLAEFDQYKPRGLSTGFTVRDVGPISPPTLIPGRPQAEPVQPGLLTLLWPEDLPIEAVSTTAANSTGRRTALARWITQPDNRLTTRVIANRLWQYHFGQGLARTPNDFGRLGEAPQQAALLDYLATELPRRGWSFKQMHRLLMNSAVYRQDATGEEVRASLAADPENQLWSRARARRLSAEEIRDAALAIAGELDLQTGGPGVELAKTPRRSVFGKILRNDPDELLESFDAAETFRSVATRNTTTTPTQSLMLINGPWMLERAKKFAARIDSAAQGDQRRAVQLAYRLAYGRSPSPAETDAASAFLTEQAARATDAKHSATEAPRAALIDLCHVLLNSSEFLYVE